MLLICIIFCISFGISRGYDFDTVLPGENVPDQGVDHVVDLNVSTHVWLTREANETALVWLRVEVPYYDDAANVPFCPSLYLADFRHPIGPEENLTYFAVKDNMGSAKSECAMIDHSYDRSTFTDNITSRYSSVTSRWNVTFRGDRAVYETVRGFTPDFIFSQCGGTETWVERLDIPGHDIALERRVSFPVYVCQVGYYGPKCDGSDDSYASTCTRSHVSIIHSPILLSSAVSMPTLSRPIEGQLRFVNFDTTDVGGCEHGRSRGIVQFNLTTSSFDSLLALQYINPPNANNAFSSEVAREPLDFQSSPEAKLHVYGPLLNSDPDVHVYLVTFVTEFIDFVKNTSFVDHFGNTYTMGPHPAAQFRFLANFVQGHQLSINTVVDGSVFVDSTPSNGTCLQDTSRSGWPWAVPTGMTFTVLVTTILGAYPPLVS